MAAPLIASCAAACFYGVASVLQSAAAKKGGAPGAKGLVSIARQPQYVAGLACDLVAWLLMVYSVRHLPLFAVQTVLASSLIVTALLGWLVLGCRLHRRDITAMAVAIVGLVLVGTSARLDAPADRDGAVRWVLLAACPITIAAGAVLSRRSSPVALGAIAGLLFSLSATSIRTIDDIRTPLDLAVSPLGWAVGVYCLAGLAFHARALEGGRVGPVSAVTWSTEIVVGSSLGFVLLGDQVRPGAAWHAALGLALALGSTVVLAQRSPADVVAVSPEPAPA